MTVSDNGPGGALTDPATVTIDILADATNQFPPVLGDAGFPVAENTGNGTLVTTLVATDADPVNGGLTYEITAGNALGIFSLGLTSGELRIGDNTELDRESIAQVQLTVQVSDNGPGSAMTGTATVTIDITGVNEFAPTIENATFTIPENTQNGTVIGTLSAEDLDAGAAAPSFSLASGSPFAVDATTGEVTVVDENALDFEITPQNMVTVDASVTDGGGLSDTAILTVKLQDVNEPPLVALANTTTTLPEYIDTSAPVKVADIFVSDDALGTFILSLAGADAGLFEIVGSELFLKANVGLDYDVQAELNVTVQVDDPSLGAGADDSDALTIQILALGDLDGDGTINTIDLAIFKQAFFTNDPVGDFNNDGIVNTIDLAIFKQAFLNAASSSPSTSSQTSAPLAASSATPELRAQTAAAPSSGNSSAGSSVENPITPSRMVEQPPALDHSARTVPFSKAQPGHHIRVFGASGDVLSSSFKPGLDLAALKER
ncbi:MAG: hypothetical protein GY926_13345, partial [bacterium]|nr:hypothetical protein [bacterium]